MDKVTFLKTAHFSRNQVCDDYSRNDDYNLNGKGIVEGKRVCSRQTTPERVPGDCNLSNHGRKHQEFQYEGDNQDDHQDHSDEHEDGGNKDRTDSVDHPESPDEVPYSKTKRSGNTIETPTRGYTGYGSKSRLKKEPSRVVSSSCDEETGSIASAGSFESDTKQSDQNDRNDQRSFIQKHRHYPPHMRLLPNYDYHSAEQGTGKRRSTSSIYSDVLLHRDGHLQLADSHNKVKYGKRNFAEESYQDEISRPSSSSSVDFSQDISDSQPDQSSINHMIPHAHRIKEHSHLMVFHGDKEKAGMKNKRKSLCSSVLSCYQEKLIGNHHISSDKRSKNQSASSIGQDESLHSSPSPTSAQRKEGHQISDSDNEDDQDDLYPENTKPFSNMEESCNLHVEYDSDQSKRFSDDRSSDSMRVTPIEVTSVEDQIRVRSSLSSTADLPHSSSDNMLTSSIISLDPSVGVDVTHIATHLQGDISAMQPITVLQQPAQALPSFPGLRSQPFTLEHHGNQMLVKCPKCTKLFAGLPTFWSHSCKDASSNDSVSDIKKWKCELCWQVFPSWEELVIHQKTHITISDSADGSTLQPAHILHQQSQHPNSGTSEHMYVDSKELGTSILYATAPQQSTAGQTFITAAGTAHQFQIAHTLIEAPKTTDMSSLDLSVLHTTPTPILQANLEATTQAQTTLYHCQLCQGLYQSQAELEAHICANSSISEQSEGNLSVKSPNDTLSELLQADVMSKCGRCMRCGENCPNVKTLQEHKCDPSKHVFKCNKCGYIFQQFSHLIHHEQVHSHNGKSMNCMFCGRHYSRMQSLRQHLLTHSGPKAYKCQFCPETFHRQDSLHTHEARHTGLKPFSCGTCGKSFFLMKDLRRHELGHNKLAQAQYQCSQCDHSFNTAFLLKSHMRLHLGTAKDNLKCDTCGKIFSRIFHLEAHMLTHTRERPYACSVCSKTFRHTTNLRRHKLTHTDTKPFNCEICGKLYSYSNDLKRHMKNHTGEKLFDCNICGRRFVRMDALKTHQWTHSDEKPFNCGLCGKGFAELRNLKRHSKIHLSQPPATAEIAV